MTDSQKRVVGAVVRWALMLLFGALSQHKVVDGPLLGTAIDELTAQIVGYIGVAGVGAWSLLQKWMVSRKIAIALALPAGSSEEHVNTVAMAVPPGKVPTVAEAARIVKE